MVDDGIPPRHRLGRQMTRTRMIMMMIASTNIEQRRRRGNLPEPTPHRHSSNSIVVREGGEEGEDLGRAATTLAAVALDSFPSFPCSVVDPAVFDVVSPPCYLLVVSFPWFSS